MKSSFYCSVITLLQNREICTVSEFRAEDRQFQKDFDTFLAQTRTIVHEVNVVINEDFGDFKTLVKVDLDSQMEAGIGHFTSHMKFMEVTCAEQDNMIVIKGINIPNTM